MLLGNLKAILQAAKKFEEACRLDTNFALAYAWQAIAYLVVYAKESDMNQNTYLIKYKKAISQAISLAPDIPEINIAKSNYLEIVNDDLNAAMREIEIANVKRPNDVDILYSNVRPKFC